MTGDEFGAIFAEHQDAVYQFAWRMTNSRAIAEDIAQDVFMEILRGRAEFDPHRGSVRALLLGIARHFAWKQWGPEQRWRALNDEALVTPRIAESIRTEEAVSMAPQTRNWEERQRAWNR